MRYDDWIYEMKRINAIIKRCREEIANGDNEDNRRHLRDYEVLKVLHLRLYPGRPA